MVQGVPDVQGVDDDLPGLLLSASRHEPRERERGHGNKGTDSDPSAHTCFHVTSPHGRERRSAYARYIDITKISASNQALKAKKGASSGEAPFGPLCGFLRGFCTRC